MPENLKDLSDRATPGEAYADMGDYRLIAHPPGSTYIPDRTLVALCACGEKAGANVHFLAALWTTYRRGELHDATALATAVARARREALEEAAAHLARKANSTAQWGGHLAAGVIADCVTDILSLAATPPEARQTETGDDRATVLLGIIEAARAEVAFAAADEADGTANQQTRRVRLKSITAALHGVGDVQARRALGLLAPPAIGNLEGEGRS